MTLDVKKLSAVALIAFGIAIVYWQVFRRLIEAWIVDGNYSHGWLIVPLAGYFAWERRERLARDARCAPAGSASSSSPAAILVLLAGLYGSELFLTACRSSGRWPASCSFCSAGRTCGFWRSRSPSCC